MLNIRSVSPHWQVTSGSIIVLHMPEKGFREHTLKEMELLLEGLKKRGLRSVTLTRLAELCEIDPEQDPREDRDEDVLAFLAA